MPPKLINNYTEDGKRCPKCKKVKLRAEYGLKEFEKNWARCKTCNSSIRKLMRASDHRQARTCVVCHTPKAGDEFYGGSNICVVCHNFRGRQWSQSNPKRVLAKRYRRMALEIGNYTSIQVARLQEHYSPEARCMSCGCSEITRDHVIPLSKGGVDELGNLQFLCGRCNREKGLKTIDYRPDCGQFARSFL